MGSAHRNLPSRSTVVLLALFVATLALYLAVRPDPTSGSTPAVTTPEAPAGSPETTAPPTTAPDTTVPAPSSTEAPTTAPPTASGPPSSTTDPPAIEPTDQTPSSTTLPDGTGPS